MMVDVAAVEVWFEGEPFAEVTSPGRPHTEARVTGLSPRAVRRCRRTDCAISRRWWRAIGQHSLRRGGAWRNSGRYAPSRCRRQYVDEPANVVVHPQTRPRRPTNARICRVEDVCGDGLASRDRCSLRCQRSSHVRVDRRRASRPDRSRESCPARRAPCRPGRVPRDRPVPCRNGPNSPPHPGC